MSETATMAGPDRAAIRTELDAMESGYGALVGEIGAAHWKTQSGIPAWTCGQLAWHLASGLSFQAGQIEGAAKGGKATNPPGFLMPLIFKASEVRVRLASRNATPESVQADFAAGMKRLRAALDATDDATLGRSATSLGETRTVAAMFVHTAEHLTEHAADIRKGLASS